MKPTLLLLLCLNALWAQSDVKVHNLEIAGGGMFPLGGYVVNNYSAGPLWRPSYEIRPSKFVGAEVGFTQSWMPRQECGKFDCNYPREMLKFLDYGLRGHIPIRRVDISAGIGGAYVWYKAEPTSFLNNGLLQYSGKASIALDEKGRCRAAVTVRTYRDPGRPTQQWISTTGSIIFGFGGH